MDFEQVQARAMEEMVSKRQAAIDLFKIDETDWAVDQEAGVINFLDNDNAVATAPVQIIGTYHPEDGTWLWAWGNPSIASAIAQHAQSVREYGTKQKIKELTESPHKCSEGDCWRYAALACHLNDAQGCYKGPTNGPLVFMTYGEVSLLNDGAAKGNGPDTARG